MKKLKEKFHMQLAKYLEKHGWVVFYLEEKQRKCTNDFCWLELYESIRKSNKVK